MRRLVVPVAAAAAVLAVSLVPAIGHPAGVPTGSAPVTVPGERPCHFLRVAPFPDVDPRFVLPPPSLGGPPTVGDGRRSAVVVPPAAAPEPTPVPVALGGQTCHPPPPLVPLRGR
jgi:hypothetical protein